MILIYFGIIAKKVFNYSIFNRVKLITNILPPGFNFFVALIIPNINSVISLLTKILIEKF